MRFSAASRLEFVAEKPDARKLHIEETPVRLNGAHVRTFPIAIRQHSSVQRPRPASCDRFRECQIRAFGFCKQSASNLDLAGAGTIGNSHNIPVEGISAKRVCHVAHLLSALIALRRPGRHGEAICHQRTAVAGPVLLETYAPACAFVSRNAVPSPHYSRLAADLSEASGIGRVDGGFRGGFSLRVGDTAVRLTERCWL